MDGGSVMAGADETTGFFVAIAPLVTLSPRPSSENIEPKWQALSGKKIWASRSLSGTADVIALLSPQRGRYNAAQGKRNGEAVKRRPG